MPATTITEFHSNEDGTYLITFSGPVTVSATAPEANILLHSSLLGWQVMLWTATGTATTQTCRDVNFDTDCDAIVILGSPAHATATPAIQIASPIIAAL